MQLDQAEDALLCRGIQAGPGLRGEEVSVVTLPRQEQAIFVEDPGFAPGHAGAEVVAGRTEDGNQAASHVLATVVAHAFDHGEGTGVANGEALACASGGKERAAGRAVKGDVAEDRVEFRLQSRAPLAA